MGKPSTLDDLLVQELASVCIRTFGPGMSRKEAKSHITFGDYIFVAFGSNGEPVGFAVSEIREESGRKVLYLGGAVVSQETQGEAIYTSFNKLRIELAQVLNCDVIKTRTQNPRVECGIKDAVAKAPEEMVYREGDPVAVLGYALEKRVYVPGAYGRMLTSDVPRSKSQEVNEEYDKQLNYHVGDAFELYFSLFRSRRGQDSREVTT